jgi:glycosyltransferase 2 family protein
VKAAFWKNFAKYGLGLALLAYVIWANWDAKGDSPGLSGILQKPIHWGPLAAATALWTGGLLLTFYRWYVLVRALNLPFRFRDAARLGLIGCYFNTFLPGSIGGDILKAAFLAREQNRRTAAVATVLMDRAIGLWGLVWLVALLGGVFWLTGAPELLDNDKLRALVLFSAAVVIASLAAWLLLGLLPERRSERFAGRLSWMPRVGKTLAELWRTVWLYRKQNVAVFQALGLSLVGHCGFVLTFHFAVQTFHEPAEVASLTQHVLIVPVGLTVQALVFTPGGLGFGEFSFGKLYEVLHRPAALGVEGSLVQRIISWVVGLFGLIVYRHLKAQHPPELENLRTFKAAPAEKMASAIPAPSSVTSPP